MLKIKQSYHGSGGVDGYKWEVYTKSHDYLGEVKDFPLAEIGVGDTVSLNSLTYEITAEYDSDIPGDEQYEVFYFELEPAYLKADFDLGVVKR